MTPEALHRFEQSIRTHSDVEAALNEMDQVLAQPDPSVEDRIRQAALLALFEEGKSTKV